MKLIYRPLLQVNLRHGFYQSGLSTEDFNVIPSEATARLFAQTGVIFRPTHSGFSIFVEVTQDSIEPTSPPSLPETLREFSIDALRMHFYLVEKNTYLSNITDLPNYRPGKQLFYFNNLRDDQVDGRLHLGDSFINQRIGEPLSRPLGNTVTYAFSPAVSSATMELEDAFGNAIFEQSFDHSELGNVAEEYRLDLSSINNLAAGRYLLRHQGGPGQPLSFFYDPNALSGAIFGVIELFDSTVNLTTNNSEQVPLAYRFLIDNRIQQIDGYTVQFEPRKTTWRYLVNKKYDTSPYTLNNLDPIADFSKSVDGNLATFTSNQERDLSELPASITLFHSGTELTKLPSPHLTTHLQKGLAEGSFISDMYVYV